MRVSAALVFLLATQHAESEEECGVRCAAWWKEYLSSEEGNSWFEPWNQFMQAKLSVMATIAEERDTTKTDPYRVLMMGDSTMSHQFGSVCGFMAEREGRRFNPKEEQRGSPGCCMDTLPKENGGGRGLCFRYDNFRFLDPRRPERAGEVDAFYFGSGLHLLHMYPHWPAMNPMEPLRIKSWLNYESLLEGVVNAARAHNGPDIKVVFMTNHVIADELFRDEYQDIRAAYREGEGNATIRAACQREHNIQVREASVGNPTDFSYYDWHAPDIAEHITNPDGEGLFTVDTYCEEAILDRRGSLQMSRRARPVMSRLGVPIVDAARIVEGQAWASKPKDGRHFHKIVPIEVAELLDVLGAPPPPASLPGGGSPPASGSSGARDEPSLTSPHPEITRQP